MVAHHVTPVVQAVIDRLNAKTEELGLRDVFYGDEENIPRTPAAAVEGDGVERELLSTSLRTENWITVTVVVYHSKLQDNESNRKSADELAEAVADILDADTTMGGTVIFGFCREIEVGYAARGRYLLRAARISWAGKTIGRIGA